MAATPQVWESYVRLEPGRPDADLAEGLAARIGDPVWFLARQWQLGEHLGEDASTPVVVQAQVRRVPIGQAGSDPVTVPPEAVVEAELGSWWTIGRRLRLGEATAAGLTPAERHAFRIGPLPPPYDLVDPAAVDGQTVWKARPLDPAFTEVPAPRPADSWDPSTLTYGEDFSAGGADRALTLRGHDGGPLDWYSIDGAAPAGPDGVTVSTSRVLSSRLTWPGAPNPRWWQIEDHRVDWAGEGPDRAHLATTLLLELLAGHGDDWFTFTLPDPARADAGAEPPPTTGHIVELVSVEVHDDMEGAARPWPLAPPSSWSLFRTAGLAPTSLVVWPTVVTPVFGPVLDQVLLSVDEDTDLAWAVELLARGERLLPDAQSLKARAQVERLGASGPGHSFDYLPSSTLPPHWHPYRVENRPTERIYVQGLVQDLNDPARLAGQPPHLRDGPTSTLIGGAPGSRFGTGHELRPVALPNQGLALERRYVLGRDTNGRPVLWVQRARRPLVAGPTSWLRFDVLNAAP